MLKVEDLINKAAHKLRRLQVNPPLYDIRESLAGVQGEEEGLPSARGVARVPQAGAAAIKLSKELVELGLA